MTDRGHKFRIGQIVDLIPSTLRSPTAGHFEIVSLRPADSDDPKYCVKGADEAYVRVVSESDLIPSGESPR
jgi:hypothetical protein